MPRTASSHSIGFHKTWGSLASTLVLTAAIVMAPLSVVLYATAQPAGAVPALCGSTISHNLTLTSNLNCSGYDGNALTIINSGVTINLNGYTLTGGGGAADHTGVYADGNYTN